MKRRHTLLSAVAIALAVAAPAAAHVTLNPDAVPADSFSRFAIRVPTERENASTTKVTIRLPRGLFFVSFQPKPGWKRSVTMEKLDPPAEVFGEMVTERVASVTWEGGKIAPGEFDEFGLSAKVPNAPGTKLTFPSVQTYSNGEIVRWIGPPDADEPAPQVTLEQPETPVAEPTTGESEADADEGEGEDRANLALGFGVAGLVAGLAALGLNLRRRRA
jgi:periplasmic copper chaperone A